MKYVVDTHALIWFLIGSPKLGPNAKLALENTNNQFVVPATALAEACWIVDLRSKNSSVSQLYAHTDYNQIERRNNRWHIYKIGANRHALSCRYAPKRAWIRHDEGCLKLVNSDVIRLFFHPRYPTKYGVVTIECGGLAIINNMKPYPPLTVLKLHRHGFKGRICPHLSLSDLSGGFRSHANADV